MNKKIIAFVLEVMPIISAIVSWIFILIPYGSKKLSYITPACFMLAFFGFVFFFIGRKLCKNDKIVRILGICDLISTASIIAIYIIAIFVFGF